MRGIRDQQTAPCAIRRSNPLPTLRAATLLAALLAGALPSALATPPIDAVGAYNHANVMTRPRGDGDSTRPQEKIPDRQAATGEDGSLSRSQFDALVADLRREYHERVSRDGRAAADAWLRRHIALLEQRYIRIED